jgi:hypothetical protein
MTLSSDPTPRQGGDHEAELYNLLKTSSDPNPKTSVETNEEASTVGTQQLYPDPKGRESGTLDAPWGEASRQEKGRQNPFHNSSGVWDEHKQTRFGVLDKAFSGFDAAAAVAKGIIGQHFTTKDYETHTALLQPKADQQVKVSHSREPTLLERVKGLVGRP